MHVAFTGPSEKKKRAEMTYLQNSSLRFYAACCIRNGAIAPNQQDDSRSQAIIYERGFPEDAGQIGRRNDEEKGGILWNNTSRAL
jgi:hypothetical protein